MALLIDGYNLLHVTDIFGAASGTETALHASRRALLEFLASALDVKSRGETTIVFDAAGAPPGLPRTIVHEGITAHFARGYSSADDMLEELIDAHTAPRTLVVVSSDHRVQRAARRRGAEFVDSEHWYAERKTALRVRNTAAENVQKPALENSAEQVEYWVKKFADPNAADPNRTDIGTPESIFPPGYGEDLLT